MRVRNLIFSGLIVCLFGAYGFTVWDTTTPSGSEAKSQGDDRIRELKTDIQTALQHQGVFPGADTSSPRFMHKLSTGSTSDRPTGNNVSTGTWRVNTTSNTIEQYNGSVWSAVDVIPSSSITGVKISSNAINPPLMGGHGNNFSLNIDTNTLAVKVGTMTINTAISTFSIVGSSLTTREYPKFHVAASSDSSNVASNYYIPFSSTVAGAYDTHGGYDSSSTHTYTIPAGSAGYWEFTVQAKLAQLTTANPVALELELFINGVETYTLENDYQNGNALTLETLNFTVTRLMAVGDKLNVRVSGSTGSSDIIDDLHGTFFEGRLIP